MPGKVLALIVAALLAQQQQPPPLAPLHQTILTVFDTNKDNKLTIPECKAVLLQFKSIAQDQTDQIYTLADKAIHALPTIFTFIDIDQSKTLNLSELKWITQAHQRIQKKKLLFNVTKDVFDAADADSSEDLDQAEILSMTEQPLLGKILEIFDSRFPIPGLSSLLDEKTVKSHLDSVIIFLDTDGDGKIARAELYKTVGTMKSYFIKAANTITQMGPMLTMFAGMSS